MCDIFQDAEGRLTRYFEKCGWESYDGIPTNPDAALSVHDIVLAQSLNARLSRFNVCDLLSNKDRIASELGKIRTDASLNPEFNDWEQVSALFKEMCLPDIGGAKATKILHKKRPNLIPIYDNELNRYCQMRIPRWTSMKAHHVYLIAFMRLMQCEMETYRTEIDQLLEFTVSRGWPISDLRLLELLIWMSVEGRDWYRTPKAA